MSDQLSKFELQREQFATGLADVAKSLRSCAQFADEFAKVVSDTPYSPETAAILQGVSESGKGKRKAAHSPEDGEGPKKRRRNIKPKDPNAPKRPASSYILFQNDVRKELKERHPNLSNSDLLGMISEQWKKMSQEQKETYNQMMRNAKAQYSEDKKAYDSLNQAEGEVASAAKTPEKEGAITRVSKPASSRGAGTSVLPPRIKATEVSPSSDSTDGDESEGEQEQAQVPIKKPQQSDSSDELEDAPETKNRSTGAVAFVISSTTMTDSYRNPDTRPLPKGWSTDYSEQYKTWYYINTETHPPQSVWEHPGSNPPPPPKPQYAPPPSAPPHSNSPPAYNNTGYPSPPSTGGYYSGPSPQYHGSGAPYQQGPQYQGSGTSAAPYQQGPQYQASPAAPYQQSSQSGQEKKGPGMGGLLGGLLGGKIGKHGSSAFGGGGSGYPAQQNYQKPSKKHGGMGGGAGLALGAGAGLLGGLLVADAFDDNFDDDCGGGDFGDFGDF